MNYNENLAYDEPFYQYDGVKVVSPESIGLSATFGNANVLAIFLLSPPSIDSTIVFVDSSKVIVDETIEISTASFLSMEVLDEQPFSYIAFSVEEDSTLATAEIEKVHATSSSVVVSVSTGEGDRNVTTKLEKEYAASSTSTIEY